MRKIYLLLFLNLLTFLSKAQIIRVSAGTNLQAAIDNATNGTTFLVEGGSYGNLIISKRVALIGTGYLLGANGTNTQANPNVATLGTVNFNSRSQNSFITGFQTNAIYCEAHNITIQRNYIVGAITGASADNLSVKQNYIRNGVNIINGTGFNIKNNLVGLELYIQNIASVGNVINNTFNTQYNRCSSDSSATTGYFYTFQPNSSIYKNNLFIGKIFPTSSACGQLYSFLNYFTFDNNLIGGVTNVNTSNTVTADFSNMFVGFPNNPNGLPIDARFQLPSNSPAKGVGANGTDVGAFGGDEPYVLSGIPIGPTIYELTVPTSTAVGQTIQEQIKAKVQN